MLRRIYKILYYELVIQDIVFINKLQYLYSLLPHFFTILFFPHRILAHFLAMFTPQIKGMVIVHHLHRFFRIVVAGPLLHGLGILCLCSRIMF
jgi:hypothetical protein